MKDGGKVEVFRTVVWSAGAGCYGGCGQKLYVKEGKFEPIGWDEAFDTIEDRLKEIEE